MGWSGLGVLLYLLPLRRRFTYLIVKVLESAFVVARDLFHAILFGSFGHVEIYILLHVILEDDLFVLFGIFVKRYEQLQIL